MPESTASSQEESTELESRMVELSDELSEATSKVRQAISDEGVQIEGALEEVGGARARIVPSASEIAQGESEGSVGGEDEPVGDEAGDTEGMERESAGSSASGADEQDDVEGAGESGEQDGEVVAGSEGAVALAGSEELAERRFAELGDPDQEQIRSLDDELALLADDLVAGDVSDGLEELGSGEEEAQAVSGEGASESQPPSVGDEALRDLEEIAAASESVDREIESRHGDEPAPAPAVAGPAWVAWLQRAAGWSLRLARKYWPVILAELRPLVRKTCEILSRPLDGRPPVFRQSVGLVGAATVVYALVVLFYIIAIRTPHREPVPPTDVVLRAGDGRSVVRSD